MKEPETIKGYVSLLRKIEKITISDKKGFENLPREHQLLLLELSAAISNIINTTEIKELK